MSVFQYGMPHIERFSPAGICARNACQLESTSPDQQNAPVRCWPANAERVRIVTRFEASAAFWRRATPSTCTSG